MHEDRVADARHVLRGAARREARRRQRAAPRERVGRRSARREARGAPAPARGCAGLGPIAARLGRQTALATATRAAADLQLGVQRVGGVERVEIAGHLVLEDDHHDDWPPRGACFPVRQLARSSTERACGMNHRWSPSCTPGPEACTHSWRSTSEGQHERCRTDGLGAQHRGAAQWTWSRGSALGGREVHFAC